MEFIEIGRVVRSHGLKGHVKAISYLESAERLRGISGLFVGRNVETAVFFQLVSAQAGRDSFILRLAGVDDREAAERLRGLSLWISFRKEAELPEGEYYWSEIIGLQVWTEEDRMLGRIEGVFPTGSNDVYVCRGEGGEILLPAIEEVVRKVDTDRGIMVVKLLEGLG